MQGGRLASPEAGPDRSAPERRQGCLSDVPCPRFARFFGADLVWVIRATNELSDRYTAGLEARIDLRRLSGVRWLLQQRTVRGGAG